jgi:CRISPR system Cascade subunit CasC
MTTEARFAQFHFLTSYPASLINRDDVGFAKRVPFGGAVRTRISSQCLKRHWRTYEGENSLWEIKDAFASVRSRRTFEEFVFRPLVEQGVSAPLAHAASEGLMKLMLGRSDKAEAASQKKRKDSAEEQIGPRSEQVTVLGRPELDYLLAQVRELCAAVTDPAKMAAAIDKHFDHKQKENLRALKLGAGLDAAMFGRMITGDILARCDAAVHVAHAFTVHSEETESDYFSAVDDLLKSGENEELGSGHIGTVELTSGLFYGYVVIDLPLLMRNLSGDGALAAQVLERMVHIIATVSQPRNWDRPPLTRTLVCSSSRKDRASRELSPMRFCDPRLRGRICLPMPTRRSPRRSLIWIAPTAATSAVFLPSVMPIASLPLWAMTSASQA